MKPYHKIETLFDRGPDFSVDEDRLRNDAFGAINYWIVTEKIDGSSGRLIFTDDGFKVGGRTEKSEFSTETLAMMQDIGDHCADEVSKIREEHGLESLTLYGEMYGPKIQSGGYYRDNQSFVLFDVMANSKFLSERDVTATAFRLGLERVPVLGVWNLDTIVELVKSGSVMTTTAKEPRIAEGIIAKPQVPLYDARGNRVMFKLKYSDFKAGKR